jgi:NAD(P)-dependent dehydrogenase (short-subunit alcohol dehydrogenase family)
MTKSAAVEYAKRGIRINSVGPGFIDTPLLAAADQDVIAGVSSLHPLGRLGRASEVAELVAFLASEKASNTTGSYFLTDGGYTAQ